MGKSRNNHTLLLASGSKKLILTLKRYCSIPKARPWYFKILILALLIKPSSTEGQFIGFEIQNRRRSHSFTFEKYNNLIIVPVVINNRLPAKFILDTGVRSTIITDRAIAELANVRYDRQITISGAGRVRNIEAFLASNVTLALPGIEGRGQSLIVLAEDYLELQYHVGANVYGILGYEFFSHFTVMINYEERTITVFEPGTFRAGRRFSKIPFEMLQARPYIYSKMIQPDGSSFYGKFLVDSGASHALLIEADSDTLLVKPQKRFPTIIGRGLGGELKGYFARLPAIKIDKFQFNNVVVSYTHDFSDPEIAMITGRNGSIGGDLLSRFTTVFDYESQMIYLRKNRTYREPFEFNMSGLEVIAKSFDFRTFEIINVMENSPAKRAGVEKGDIILRFNGVPASDITLNEILFFFRSRPERMVNLTLLRGDEQVRIRFRLQRIV